jgi:hypothetical protein
VSKAARRRGKGSAPALDQVRWKGQECFRLLSYYFLIRWNVEEAGERVRQALSDFAVPPDPAETEIGDGRRRAAGLPLRYSILKSRSTAHQYNLFFGGGEHGGDELTTSNRLHDLLSKLFWHVNQFAIRQTGDFVLIHAGAVSTPAGEGMLLPARSGGGKTTLTTALVRAGFQYLTDDAAPVDPVSGTLYPYPKPVNLKRGSGSVFPDLFPSRTRTGYVDWRWMRPAQIRPGAVGGPCRIRFVVAHEYRPGAPTEITRVTPAESAMDLLNNSLNFPRYRARALPLVADIARESRSYRMVSGNLDEAVRAITEITNGHRSTTAEAGR